MHHSDWNGSTRASDFVEEAIRTRNALADAAKSCDWPAVFVLLREHGALVNAWRPGGQALYAPLHQAAHAGASLDTVRQLVDLGAWRSLRNAQGERALDVAVRMGHDHLRQALQPVFKHNVPLDVLAKIQSHFHQVIRGRIDRPLPDHALRLPELEPLLELDRAQMWFAVPGMYGGFSYRLEGAGAEALLVSESWSRVVGGSGQRHHINAEGGPLVDEGFV